MEEVSLYHPLVEHPIIVFFCGISPPDGTVVGVRHVVA